MKTTLLTLMLLLSAVCTFAQWSLGFQTGINKTLYKSTRDFAGITHKGAVKSSPAFLASAYLLSDKDMPVNLGLALGVKSNDISVNLTRQGYNTQINNLVLEHKSTFIAISPIVDVSIDKKRIIHFLASPSVNIFVSGKENGSSKYSSGEEYYYTNTSRNIKKLSLGISGQLQGRFPLANSLAATGSLGYSINNAISSRLPGEAGNVFLQVGVIYKIPSLTRKNKDNAEGGKTKAEEPK